MRTHIVAAAAFMVLLSSCDSKPEARPVAETPKAVEMPRPADESRRFPKPNLVGTIVIEKQLFGKPFMPGGTQAHYKKGRTEYDMFIAKTASASDAALLLPDWRSLLTDAKLVASFGGYFGTDAGKPVFVFTKGAWIAGVAGLNQKEADQAARKLAAALN
jgi:hypothetical protein